MGNLIFESAIDLVKRAGQIITENSGLNSRVETKSFGNFVTQVDCEVQDYIKNGLREILPESSFVGEENFNSLIGLNKHVWILDPIDGTTNFIHSYPHVAISLALYEKSRGLFGIVYNPFTTESFTAIAQQGAFLGSKKIEVSNYSSLDKCIIGFGLPYKRAKAGTIFEVLDALHPRCQDFRRSGSAALDLAYVACGRLDGYFELDLRPWDFAAGKIILEEAGGNLTKWDGKRIDVLKKNNIIATNGLVHEEIMTIIDHVHSTRMTAKMDGKRRKSLIL